MTNRITAHASTIDALAINSNPADQTPWCRSLRNSPDAAEGIDEVRIDRHQFGVRMFFRASSGARLVLDACAHRPISGTCRPPGRREIWRASLMLAVDSTRPPSQAPNNVAAPTKMA
jgi:hypothetical protein